MGCCLYASSTPTTWRGGADTPIPLLQSETQHLFCKNHGFPFLLLQKPFFFAEVRKEKPSKHIQAQNSETQSCIFAQWCGFGTSRLNTNLLDRHCWVQMNINTIALTLIYKPRWCCNHSPYVTVLVQSLLPFSYKKSLKFKRGLNLGPSGSEAEWVFWSHSYGQLEKSWLGGWWGRCGVSALGDHKITKRKGA